jgi:hypothetical protein
VKKIIEETGLIEKLPERTPEEIQAKRKKYNDFTKSANYARLKTLADMQVAQFFITKTPANKPYLCTDAVYRKYIENITIPTGQPPAKAEAIAQGKKIFHYFLEFPEVFANGGFHCIVGNPPYLGGTKISTHFGVNTFNYLKWNYYPASGRCDLVGYFVRRIYSILLKNGYVSLITTNTISEGDTREGALDIIINYGGAINHAMKNVKWPGTANVYVTIITIFKGEWRKEYILQNSIVNYINAYLSDQTIIGNPHRLIQNENKAFMGSCIMGDSFLISNEKRKELINADPKNEEIISKYLNGFDLNNNPTQETNRWIINFYNMDYEAASKFKECFKIVETVKKERSTKSKDVANSPFWKYWRIREELYNSIKRKNKVLVQARSTKTHALVLSDKNKVFTDALVIFNLNDYKSFSVLQSNIHDIWAWQYSSSLKTDRRYSVSDCYYTFPMPQNILPEIQLELEKIGEDYHEFRRQLMIIMQLGLTKTYNLFHNPNCNGNNIEKVKDIKEFKSAELQIPIEEAVQRIEKLHELHKQMDEAVLKAYGWREDSEKWGDAISLRHDFYEVDYLPENDRIRYTIHPDARREVLKRLLQLNHEIYAEELKQGLHDKKKGGKKKQKKKAGQEGLGL